jgi:hypothetical protein
MLRNRNIARAAPMLDVRFPSVDAPSVASGIWKF